MKPLFISFEGVDGSGKTTHAEMLFEWMKNRNIPCILTKEPGSKYIKECVKIRELLLDPQHTLSSSAELLLFLADRAQHINSLINPSLKEGKYVICDRFSDSTRVYQSARGLKIESIDLLLGFTTAGLTPDITFLLDIPIEIGLERAKSKSIYKEGDRIEKADKQFHENVRFGFLKLAQSLNNEHRFVVLDTTPPKTVEETHNEIIEYISKKIWTSMEED